MARSPWARLTNRITPNASDRPVANSAYSPPSRMPCTIALTQTISGLHSEVGRGDRVPVELAGSTRQRDPTLEQAVQTRSATASACPMSCSTTSDRGAGSCDRGHRLVDLLHHDRGEAERHLVEQQRVGGWPSAPGRSRPPASRHPRARSARRPSRRRAAGTSSSTRVDGPVPWPAACRRRSRRFSSTVRLGKSTTALGHEGDRRAANASCAGTGERDPHRRSGSLPHAGTEPADDRSQQRRLAGAVGPDDRDRLALVDRRCRDVEQRLEVAVAGVEST